MRRAAVAWLVTLVALCAARHVSAGVPTIERPVTDLADVLSKSERDAIADLLIAARVETGVQIAVLVVSTTGGQPIEDYSLAVAEAWDGGSAKRSDGVLLVIALDDRRMRLEVGYDLEDRLTDARSRQILEGMKGELRKGAHAAAIRGAVEDIGLVVRGLEPMTRYTPEPQAGGATCADVGGFLAVVAVFILIFVILPAILGSRSSGGGSSSGWSSGGWSSWGSSSSSSSSSWSSSSSSWGGGGGSFGGGGASSSW